MKKLDELRNRLSPLKNYLALVEEIKKCEDKLDELDGKMFNEEANGDNPFTNQRIEHLEKQYDELQERLIVLDELVEQELENMRNNMPVIEDLLNKLDV